MDTSLVRIDYERMTTSGGESPRRASTPTTATSPKPGRTGLLTPERRPSLNVAALKDGLECLQNSHKSIAKAKEGMEKSIVRERRAIQKYEQDAHTDQAKVQTPEPSTTGATSTTATSRSGFGLKKWLQLQWETGKTQKKAKEDLKRAQKAMSAASSMITQMDAAMTLEEETLRQRANALRRQSVDVFTKVPASPTRLLNVSEEFSCELDPEKEEEGEDHGTTKPDLPQNKTFDEEDPEEEEQCTQL